MNLVQTTITYPPAVGGLDRYVKETSEGLVKRGHDVTVITSDLEQPHGRKQVTIPAGYVDLARVQRFPVSRIPRVGLPYNTAMTSAIRNAKPALIHTHCVLHSPALFSWQVARQQRVPLVVHTIFTPRTGIFWSAYHVLARRMINDAKAVIAISDFERDLLMQAGVAKDRVTVLAPGVDLTAFETPKPPVLSRFGFEGNRVIVSLGRLAFGKRVDRLIQALPSLIAKHPDVRLIVIGPDYGDEPRLRLIARQLRLDSVITFAGSLGEADVAAVLQQSTVFAMTTDFELFGITLIEAMAAGTAVVAPDVASVPTVVRDGVTGLLYRSNSVDDLAAGIDRVLASDDLRGALVAAGRNEASTRFSFQRNLDTLEDIYRRAGAR